MKRLAFFDSNILVYADDASAPAKQGRAIALVTEYHRLGLAVISLQVMQEYFVAATKKLGVAAEVAQRKVELLSRFRVARILEGDVVAAIELHRLTGISFWDALIIRAATIAGAETLFSEDLQHGSTVGGVRIVNPFVTD
jgi:predicted nucleic acid-binding protein